jgi:hypothetical protein
MSLGAYHQALVQPVICKNDLYQRRVYANWLDTLANDGIVIQGSPPDSALLGPYESLSSCLASYCGLQARSIPIRLAFLSRLMSSGSKRCLCMGFHLRNKVCLSSIGTSS